MKLMFIDSFAEQSNSFSPNRHTVLGRELVKMGNEVIILTAKSRDEKNGEATLSKLSESKADGLTYVALTVTNRFDPSRSSFHYRLRMSVSAISRLYSPDVIVVSASDPGCMRAAVAMCKTNQALRICFDIDCIYSELDRTQPMLWFQRRNSKKFKADTHYAIQHADYIVSCASDADAYLKSLGYLYTGITYIPSGASLVGREQRNPPQSIENEIKKLKSLGKFVAMYAGEFSKRYMVMQLLEEAAKFPKIAQLVLVGNGPLLEQMKEYVKANSLKGVTIIEHAGTDDLHTILPLADVLCLTQRENTICQYDISSAILTEYMLSKRPIIFSSKSEKNPVIVSNCGKNVVDGEFASAIYGICGMGEEALAAMGANGSSYANKHFDIAKIAKRFYYTISRM